VRQAFRTAALVDAAPALVLARAADVLRLDAGAPLVSQEASTVST